MKKVKAPRMRRTIAGTARKSTSLPDKEEMKEWDVGLLISVSRGGQVCGGSRLTAQRWRKNQQ